MNIWQAYPDVNNYWWCIFKATEKIDGLDFITLFSNENEDNYLKYCQIKLFFIIKTEAEEDTENCVLPI